MAELDPGLESRLAALASEVAYPPTPDFRRSVRARVATRPRDRLGWAWAAAAAVLLAVAAVLAVPEAREAVAAWLGIRGVTIQKVQHPPSPRAGAGGAIGELLELGRPATLSEAQRLAGFKVLVPADLGAPDAVFYSSETGAVTLVYLPRPGLPEANQTGAGALVTELKGTVQAPVLKKVLGPGTHLRETDVGGVPGYWISGAPHDLYYTDARGAVREDRLRLATNTLLWQRGEVTYRLEAMIELDQAARIATSMS